MIMTFEAELSSYAATKEASDAWEPSGREVLDAALNFKSCTTNDRLHTGDSLIARV